MEPAGLEYCVQSEGENLDVGEEDFLDLAPQKGSERMNLAVGHTQGPHF